MSEQVRLNEATYSRLEELRYDGESVADVIERLAIEYSPEKFSESTLRTIGTEECTRMSAGEESERGRDGTEAMEERSAFGRDLERIFDFETSPTENDFESEGIRWLLEIDHPSETQRILLNEIKRLQREHAAGAPREDVVDVGLDEGIPSDRLSLAIRNLKDAGRIYEAERGYLRLV